MSGEKKSKFFLTAWRKAPTPEIPSVNVQSLKSVRKTSPYQWLNSVYTTPAVCASSWNEHVVTIETRESEEVDVTLTSVPSLQCHTIPSTRPSSLSRNHDSSWWNSTAGAFLTWRIPCGTRTWSGFFLLPKPAVKTSASTTSVFFIFRHTVLKAENVSAPNKNFVSLDLSWKFCFSFP